MTVTREQMAEADERFMHLAPDDLNRPSDYTEADVRLELILRMGEIESGARIVKEAAEDLDSPIGDLEEDLNDSLQGFEEELHMPILREALRQLQLGQR